MARHAPLKNNASHNAFWQGYVYSDPNCYSYSLNHVVLVIGYLIAGEDPEALGLAPPFWIIRNSWGPEWGDGGLMRMRITGGDGVCGINTLPPLYPVVKSKNPSLFIATGLQST